MDIYGKSPISLALSQIKSINKVASFIYVNPKAYRDIYRLKKAFKKPKSDISWIRRLTCFPINKIKYVKAELSFIDIDFQQIIRTDMEAIYKAFQIPKEYLQSTT